MKVKQGFLVRYIAADRDLPVSLNLPTAEECAYALGLAICANKGCAERINRFGMHAHIPDSKFSEPQSYSGRDVEKAGHFFRVYKTPCRVSITWHFWSKADSPPVIYFQEQKIVCPDEAKG